MSKEWQKHTSKNPAPEPDPRVKMSAKTKAKRDRIRQESQSKLDRCWNALPVKCPMRKWDREQFNTCWRNWEALATALVDWKFERDFSVIIAEYITGAANQFQMDAIERHIEWLMTDGSKSDLERWESEYSACQASIKTKRIDNELTKKRLLLMLTVMEGLPHKEGRYAAFSEEPLDYKERNGNAPIEVTTARIKAECQKQEPRLFPEKMSKYDWRDLFALAEKHWLGLVPRAPWGRPKKGTN